jgi:DNA (cytosine-5)-methyltransferase 1
MFSLIKANRPNWVVNENVTGSISNLVLDQKIADLEKIGYTCGIYIIPAVACNAEHERKRVFIVANANVQRRRELLCVDPGASFQAGAQTTALGTQGNPFLRFEESVAEPALFPVDDGIPDQIFRLGAAGNSIFATIPIILLEAIWAIENSLK